MGGEKKSRGESNALMSIIEGASLYFVGRMLSKAIRFFFNLVMTRALGATLYGVYSYAVIIQQFAMLVSRFGSDQSFLRFIPEYSGDAKHQSNLVGIGYTTTLMGSIIIAAILFLSSPTIADLTLGNQSLVPVLRIFSLSLPFLAIADLTNSVFRGVEKMQYQVISASIAQPIIELVFVSIAFALGYSLIGATAGVGVAMVVVCGIALFFLFSRTDIHPNPMAEKGGAVEFYNFSLPLTFKAIGSFMYSRVDLLMVGVFLTGSSVGIYQITTLLSGFLTLPLSAINQLFPSIAAGLYADDDTDQLNSIFGIVTRWVLTAVIPMCLVLFIYPFEVLSIFGPDFTDGTLVLVLFTFSQLVNSAVGPSAYVVLMTGHQYLNMINQWLLGGLNIILNYLLITQYGLIGAALATALVLILINALRIVEVWYLERLFPYSSRFVKPLLSGVTAGTAMLFVKWVLDGYPLLIVGSATGVAIYISVLVLLGIDDEDREFLATVR